MTDTANPRIFTFLQSLMSEMSFRITPDNLPIRSAQLRARLRLYPVMVLSQAFLEPLFVWMFWEHTDQQHLLWWLAVIYTIHIIDVLQWWRFRTQLDNVQECIRWDRVFKLFTTLTALMWGGIALSFYPSDLAYQALMICLILGLVAGAVTMDSVYPPSLYIYVFGVTTPLLARLLLSGDETHLILGIMLLLFLSGALSAGRVLSKTFWKSLWQRYENDLLVMQLTEQKAIAETANHDKSRFLASASHDLRQPLQALVLFSEALQDAAQEKETRHLATQIGKSVEGLVDMFDKLLDISRFDAGVVNTITQHFRVRVVFERLKAEFMPLAYAKDLNLIVLHSNQVGESDPYLLERILRNLISNAIRYTDTGIVQLSCRSVDNKLQFDVMDTGIGIQASSMEHIFDEYFQVDNQHRDQLKGLGLGLAIVRRMESLLGCKVTVASQPDLGSIFSFSIPKGDTAKIEPSQVIQHSKHDLSGITVALVDDNLDIRQMISKLMKQWGCRVIDGEQPYEVLGALEVAGIRPDIFICDYRLKHGITAIDAIRLLRELWDHKIPILVLTGDTAPQTLKEIQASGALLLHKPIAPARLRTIIHFALQTESGSEFNPSKSGQYPAMTP